MEKGNFAEFYAPSYEEWRLLAEKTLKGKPFESLLTETYEDIIIAPLYTRENTSVQQELSSLFSNNGLGIAQELKSVEAVERALKHGQSVLHFVTEEGTVHNGEQRISFQCKNDIESALKNVPLNYPVMVHAGYVAAPLLALFASYYQEKGHLDELQGMIGADPLGYVAKHGTLSVPFSSCYDAMTETIQWSNVHTPQVKTVFIQTDVYHHAGANAVQELACALATAVTYIRECVVRGVHAEDVLKQCSFEFAIDTHLFMEVAKLRAFRVLWKKVSEAFGTSYPVHVHARTSKRTKTKYDPHVNLLRTTTEAFAAIVGGADTLHVGPYDEALGTMHENSERWARNIQHLLRGESHLGKVIDPAGGSYYVESITKELAEHAWKLFQRIEAQGGMVAVLRNGFLQAEIQKVAKQRSIDVKNGKKKVVGTNVYVNTAERKVKGKKEEPIAPLGNDEGVQHGIATVDTYIARFTNGMPLLAPREGKGEVILPFHSMRDSEVFEIWREKAEQYEKITGVMPHIALRGEAKIPPYLANTVYACGFVIDQNATFVLRYDTSQEAGLLIGGVEDLFAAFSAFYEKQEVAR